MKEIIYVINDILRRKPWIEMIISIGVYIIIGKYLVNCETPWEDQWIQGVSLEKQPSWYNNREDPRLLSEQLNDTLWRKTSYHYDLKNGGTEYSAYGWCEGKKNTGEKVETCLRTESNQEYENIASEKEELVVTLAAEINLKLEDEVCEQIKNLSIKEIQQDHLKEIIKEVILKNENLEKAIQEKGLGIKMISENYKELSNPDMQEIIFWIRVHMNTQIILINSAYIIEDDVTQVLSEEELYDHIMNKILDRIEWYN